MNLDTDPITQGIQNHRRGNPEPQASHSGCYITTTLFVGRLLGGSRHFVTTSNWAPNSTYRLPDWHSVSCISHTLQIAQSRSYLRTLGPKVGSIYLLGALGYMAALGGLTKPNSKAQAQGPQPPRPGPGPPQSLRAVHRTPGQL